MNLFTPTAIFGASGSSLAINIDYLVVAGGGGGGGTWGGGGGAGGVITGSYSLSPGTYQTFVGNGGIGGARIGPTTIVSPTNGTSSYFTGYNVNFYASGGGYGGADLTGREGNDGGSGGGNGGSTGTLGVAISGGFGISGQGNDGGPSYNSGSGIFVFQTGGGGAGQKATGYAGVAFTASFNSKGGDGIQWVDGNYYGGGGGGGAAAVLFPFSSSFIYLGKPGGIGGGGHGAISSSVGYDPNTPNTIYNGGSGSVNTGGGGGGGDNKNNQQGGSGGSGIIKIRYSGSVPIMQGGTTQVSGGYVYHSFTTHSVIDYLYY